MISHLVMTAVIVAAVMGYTVYVTRKRRAGMPQAFRMFFERTGYRYADILNLPLDAHVMHGEKLLSSAGSRGHHIHMIRDFHGTPIHSLQEQRTRTEEGRRVVETSTSWWTPLPRPARIRVQIVERSLVGTVKAVKEALGNSKRPWTQHYPLSVQAGDAELDDRFLFFGVAAQEVLHILQTPGLRDLLLGCAEVDLVVDRDRVVFADPLHKNLSAGMGGYLGAIAMGTDMMKWMEMAIPVHDRMAQLLATTGRACL